MEKLRKEIKRIKKHKLEYYDSLLDVVEVYIEEKPDITIETCKSVIEGISKLVIHLLRQEPLHKLDSSDFQPLFKRALSVLSEDSVSFDSDLSKRFGSVVHCLGELRNQHCDISHGKASLKDQINDADFSEMVIGMTDSICTYMLRKLDRLTDDEVQYDENEEFNDYLDDQYPLDGKVRHSKALFEQEPETCEVRLGDYLIENNPEE